MLGTAGNIMRPGGTRLGWQGRDREGVSTGWGGGATGGDPGRL